MKDCNPNTGEPDDMQGYDDEYVVRHLISGRGKWARQHSVLDVILIMFNL